MSRTKSWCALLDIGSTYTKGLAVDTAGEGVLARTQVPTMGTGDVRISVRRCLEQLSDLAGGRPAEVYSSSSARGGLGVIAVGLVPRLTLEAAEQAALGAGAKVLRAFGYRLTADDLAVIARLRPDVILLCGGIDGGDEETLLANAARIAEQPDPDGTVIVAGNRVAAPEAVELLERGGWDVRLVPNVLPEIEVLNPEPARDAIRSVFLDKITDAKGIGLAREMLDGPLMPTPAAVLAGTELLAGRRGAIGAMGSVMVVDVGGATTDIVSVIDTPPPDRQVVHIGLPEPIVKRTVEGDLGIRHNARTITDRHGLGALLEGSEVPPDAAEEMLRRYQREPEALASDELTEAFDRILLRVAIRDASLRHCGTIEEVRVPSMRSVFRMRGKDLRAVEHIVGTGGILVHRRNGSELLQPACAEPSNPGSLRPETPELLIDRDYVLYACGLLAERSPGLALEIASTSLWGRNPAPENPTTVGE